MQIFAKENESFSLFSTKAITTAFGFVCFAVLQGKCSGSELHPASPSLPPSNSFLMSATCVSRSVGPELGLLTRAPRRWAGCFPARGTRVPRGGRDDGKEVFAHREGTVYGLPAPANTHSGVGHHQGEQGFEAPLGVETPFPSVTIRYKKSD
jgi:hypothetical protein